ncbi:demethoxyubiquinone hydroxylase family protein [Asticcacaulis sp. SL142]|uniref:demethoxyubiquinone hydroxylase family protein n=1 Tax=Asticcacaulis sp. SL142 TaxID=2995155 RepID=UPI00226C8435|nr:demethoxyubiquinone hydroxylase family protein [Asticcacaulis sp. SL142]WAC49456.1 demethoxyubiquinone hydroxylase family protein [Asticcacaulis sp. SL142]
MSDDILVEDIPEAVTPTPSGVPPRPGKGAVRHRLEEILRVDHAGELAAVHIYRAQSMVFSATPERALSHDLKRMEFEEQVHLDRFNALMREHDVRPTVMTPVWRLAAMGLGVGTALLGPKAAHACTEAVESVIEKHYAEQIQDLKDREPDLAAELTKFREDEIGHKDHAVSAGAHQAPAYPLLSAVVQAGCRLAIKISEKI